MGTQGSIAWLESAAGRVLAEAPDPAVRVRLLRDVLRRPAGDSELAAAEAALDATGQVRELAEAQHADGSWGGLHNSDRAKRIGRTETGVARALALGLDREHPILKRTREYLASLLQRRRPMPEGERNERSEPGWRMFTGSKLALIDPAHTALDEVWETWAGIARQACKTGAFDPANEFAAHARLHGIQHDIGYMRLPNGYAMALLGGRARQLPPATEAALVRWAWEYPGEFGYLGISLGRLPRLDKPYPIDAWLTAMELMSSFPTARKAARKNLEWLWSNRSDSGLWDFGPRSVSSEYFPLSASWRKPGRRGQDWTTRILVILRKYAS
jgi:hypothetical protein